MRERRFYNSGSKPDLPRSFILVFWILPNKWKLLVVVEPKNADGWFNIAPTFQDK